MSGREKRWALRIDDCPIPNRTMRAEVKVPRKRKENGLANIAVLRRRALDVVRRDQSKRLLSIKLKRPGWDDDFLLSRLNSLALDRSLTLLPCVAAMYVSPLIAR